MNGVFENFPYTNTHDLNLDWVIEEVKKLSINLADFIKINTIKYADPIGWNITKQYEANTVVIDQSTGNAYISTKPVPSGVAITNTDYWTPIFNYEARIRELMSQIAIADEGSKTTASANRTVGDLVWLSWKLYRVTANILKDNAYALGVNIIATTIETEIKNEINNRISSDNTIQTQVTDIKNHIKRIYDTVSAMVLDTTLTSGVFVATKGYYNKNDGGEAEYYITNVAQTADNCTIFSIGDLFAILVSKPVMNARCFGIKGNSTNETNRLNKAISFTASKDSKLLIPSEMTILIGTEIGADGGVVLRQNTNIQLDGTIKPDSDNYYYCVFANMDGTDHPGYSGNGNIKISGSGTFNMLGTAEGALRFGHADGIYLEGLTFIDVKDYHAIEFMGCKNVEVNKCIFKGCVFVDETAYSSPIIQIEPTTSGTGQSYATPYDNTVCKNITIENCIFMESTNHLASGIGTPNTGALVTHENINIINNIFYNLDFDCVIPFRWLYSNISGNKCENIGHSFINKDNEVSFSLWYANISNNSGYNIAKSIADNTASEDYCIVVYQGANVSIANNTFNKIKTGALNIKQSSVIITANSFTDILEGCTSGAVNDPLINTSATGFMNGNRIEVASGKIATSIGNDISSGNFDFSNNIVLNIPTDYRARNNDYISRADLVYTGTATSGESPFTKANCRLNTEYFIVCMNLNDKYSCVVVPYFAGHQNGMNNFILNHGNSSLRLWIDNGNSFTISENDDSIQIKAIYSVPFNSLPNTYAPDRFPLAC